MVAKSKKVRYKRLSIIGEIAHILFGFDNLCQTCSSYGGVVEDEKHYYYTTEWRDKLVDSDQFYIRIGHENPKQVPIRSQVQIADEVKIGSLKLGLALKKKFNEFVDVTSDERPERRDIKMHSGLYYHSADLWNPRV